MGNSITTNVNLDHELACHQEAIEAGKSLTGKVIIQVQEALEPTNLTLEVYGKEKMVVVDNDQNDDDDDGTITDKKCFFRADVSLFETDEPIEANKTYVFPFSVPLPKSLPSSTKTDVLQKQKQHANHNNNNNNNNNNNSSSSWLKIEYHMKLKPSQPSGEGEEKQKKHYKFPNKRPFLVTSAQPDGHQPIFSALTGGPLLLQPQPIATPCGGSIFMGAYVKNTHVARGQPIEVCLVCRNESSLSLESAKVTLEEQTQEEHQNNDNNNSNNKTSKVLLEKTDLETIPCIRLRGTKITTTATANLYAGDEGIARRMFSDLKSDRNILQLVVPSFAQESYTGCMVKISHSLNFTLVPEEEEDGDGSKKIYPTMKVPIQIGSEPPAPIGKAELKEQQETMDDITDKTRVRFPVATVAPDGLVVGRKAAAMMEEEDNKNNHEGNSDNSKLTQSSSNDDEPSLPVLLEEIVASMDVLDCLSEKLKDLDWAIFLACLSPDEFGSIIDHVVQSSSEFSQPLVAALLARNFGGDFTCAHAAAAIAKSSQLVRTNMVEGLLAYCSDLSESSNLIREKLTDFEQIIVALHALSEEEAQKKKDEKKATETKAAVPTIPDDAVKPEKSDICMGINDHPKNVELLSAIRSVAQSGTFPEFCPSAYRRIMQPFKGTRFIFSPAPDYWRVATNREQIEFLGYGFEHFKQLAASQQKAEDGKEPERPNQMTWLKALQESVSEWDLAVTIHTYASALDGSESGEMERGPEANDICFDKRNHPGNTALIKAVRRSIKDFPTVEWSPPIYRSIKALLTNRRYFVKVGKAEWREATQVERRENIEKCFHVERLKFSTHRNSAPRSLVSPPTKNKKNLVGSYIISPKFQSPSKHKPTKGNANGATTFTPSKVTSGAGANISSPPMKHMPLSSKGAKKAIGGLNLNEETISKHSARTALVSPKVVKKQPSNEENISDRSGVARAPLASPKVVKKQPSNEENISKHSRRSELARTPLVSPKVVKKRPSSTTNDMHASVGRLSLIDGHDIDADDDKAARRGSTGHLEAKRRVSSVREGKRSILNDEKDGEYGGRLRRVSSSDGTTRVIGVREGKKTVLNDEKGKQEHSARSRRSSDPSELTSQVSGVRDGKRTSLTEENDGVGRHSDYSDTCRSDLLSSGRKQSKVVKKRPSSTTNDMHASVGRLSLNDDHDGSVEGDKSARRGSTGHLEAKRRVSGTREGKRSSLNDEKDAEYGGRLRRVSSADGTTRVVGVREGKKTILNDEKEKSEDSDRIRRSSSISEHKRGVLADENDDSRSDSRGRLQRVASSEGPRKIVTMRDGKRTVVTVEKDEAGSRITSPAGIRRVVSVRDGKRTISVDDKDSLRRSSSAREGKRTVLNDEGDDENGDSGEMKPITRRNSARDAPARAARHPRDIDICYGSPKHPGTVDLEKAVVDALNEFEEKDWSPAVYRAIRSSLVGKRCFIRKSPKLPWEEASPEERLAETKKAFDMKREQLLSNISHK